MALAGDDLLDPLVDGAGAHEPVRHDGAGLADAPGAVTGLVLDGRVPPAVVSHRLICPGTVDERVEEVVAGKRHIADLVLPKSSSLSDLDAQQLRKALGLRPDTLLTEDDE